MSNFVRIKTIIYGHNCYNEQFVSRKRFSPDKLSKPHNLSVEFHVLPDNFSQMTPQDGAKKAWDIPRSLKNVRATETAADVSVLPREMSRSDRGVRGREALSDCPELHPRTQKKRDRGTLDHLKTVRATEAATDVSVLPREMSRSDRGVRNREALTDCPELHPRAKKKRPGIFLDLLLTCERPKRRQTFLFSLGRCHAVTEGYEAARP